MPEIMTFDENSRCLRVFLQSSGDGTPLTDLTFATAGLIISTIADNEASPTVYKVDTDGNVETITTLGTYAAPTASKCRFKEVSKANHPGVYEIQLADARFSVASSKSLLVTVSGYSTLAVCNKLIPLSRLDLGTASTPQTGDNYVVVAHADYGNAKLVRSTTPSYTLSVDVNHLVAVPTTQKVDVETMKTKPVTVDVGGTTFPAAIHASGAAVAKSPATLATADVTGNLPANVLQWGTAALPTIGTSTLTTGDIDARLLAYDGPTNTEMIARTLATAGYATPTNITAATGVILAATGLDQLSSAEVTAKPTTFATKLMWLVQRLWRADKSATAIVVKTEAGATVTTQTISESGTDETLGAPS
jgi:hypothetical protein